MPRFTMYTDTGRNDGTFTTTGSFEVTYADNYNFGLTQ